MVSIPQWQPPGARTPRHGSIEWRSHVRLNVDRMLDVAAPWAIGHVKDRVSRGLDVKDKPFEPYSQSYQRALRRGGEQTDVDLRVTGSLLSSLKVLRRVVERVKGWVDIGPGPERGPRYHFADGKRRDTGQRSIGNNTLGWYHHVGAGNNPKRRWLGISLDGRKKLARLLLRSGIIKTVAGPPPMQ